MQEQNDSIAILEVDSTHGFPAVHIRVLGSLDCVEIGLSPHVSWSVSFRIDQHDASVKITAVDPCCSFGGTPPTERIAKLDIVLVKPWYAMIACDLVIKSEVAVVHETGGNP